MRRVRRLFSRDTRLLWALGAGAFAVAAIAGAPSGVGASLLMAASPLLRIDGASGTLWRGEFANVSYDSIILGRVRYALSPGHLLLGRLAADVTSSGGALTGKGWISVSSSGFKVKDAAAEFDLGAIRRYTFYGARYQGAATLKAKTLALSSGGCKAEDAQLNTTMLDGLMKQWSGGALPLDGGFACEDGKLTLALSGEGSDGAVRMKAAISPDYSYVLTVTAAPRRAEIGAALKQFGFEGDNSALSLHAVGRLKGLTS